MVIPESVWIVIPAYNEQPAIARVLSDLADYPYHVVVVDDASQDHTLQEALKFPITVLHHAINLGQGAALQTGICYALSRKEASYIVTFDADGQHRAADIPKMLELLRTGDFDVILGTRFALGGEAINISRLRRWMIQLAIWFTRITTGLRLTDTHNGLRAFTVQAVSRLAITQNGMAHASEILYQIASLKLRYCEVPVTITYSAYSRLKGQSWTNSINILWDLFMGKMR